MRNLIFSLGVLCLTLCGPAFAEREMWVLRLQQEAQSAEETAVRHEASAKSAAGMEAFKQEAEAQYFRKLAKVKRDLAVAVEKGDQEAVRTTRSSMLELEQSRAGNSQSISPFAPSRFPQANSPAKPSQPDPAAKAGALTDEKMKEKAEHFASLSKQTEQVADGIRESSKDHPRKMRKEVDKYADLLEKLSKTQRSLAAAYQDKNSEAILKKKAELLQLRDELKSCNMGLMMPDTGLYE